MSNQGRLAGKIAFITGTAGGQGRVAAQLFAKEGARIVGCDVNADGAEESTKLVRDAGGEMISIDPVDLSDPDSARMWIEDGIAAMGGIDILYNNASAPRFGAVGEIDPADWSFTLRNELDLILWTTQAAWPHLIERGGGAVVNTSSGAGLRGHAGVPEASHAAAKGGVVALTMQLAAEGAEHRIRVNVICPGVIETPALRRAISEGAVSKLPMALGRIGRPEDVVYCALYLASDEASWVTASMFVIDGGLTGILGVEPATLEV
jgi:NAD(P)-dependent dehydrogenase (short-subunit alcohol dehydrogenase family)